MSDSPHHPIRIAGVADLSVGYGSPQVLYLTRSLQEYYQGEATLFETDQPERPPLPELSRQYPTVTIRRVSDPFIGHAPRLSYCYRVAKALNAMRPQVLVLFCTYTLPILRLLQYRPEMVIYYAIESGADKLDGLLNRMLLPQVDLLLFPEENRARLFCERNQIRDVPVGIVYNAAPKELARVCSPAPRPRTGNILHQGTLAYGLTFAEYYLQPETQAFPIDLYGLIEGAETAKLQAKLQALTSTVRYRGYISARELAQLRLDYGYSLILWNAEDNENQRYAAPNKFFEAIADGVIPITAPHPQCKMLVQRYGCGIVLEDWSYAAFLAGLQQSRTLYATPAYQAMVDGCRHAVERELTWEAQFAKITPLLKAM